MGQPHKHRDLIRAWADGAEIQWRSHYDDAWHQVEDIMNIVKYDSVEYRIKPEVAQWRKDMAQALKDGKQVMCRVWWANGVPEPTKYKASAFLDPAVKIMKSDYFIKPQPNPDVVTYYLIDKDGVWWRTYQTDNMEPNIAITFDGETGKLKSAEVLK